MSEGRKGGRKEGRKEGRKVIGKGKMKGKLYREGGKLREVKGEFTIASENRAKNIVLFAFPLTVS